MTTTTNADIVSELKHIKEELSAIRRDMNAKNYISEEEFRYLQSEQFQKDKAMVHETVAKLERGEMKTYTLDEAFEKIDKELFKNENHNNK